MHIKLVVEHATKKLVGCHCIASARPELVHIGQAVKLLADDRRVHRDGVQLPDLSEMFKYAPTMRSGDREKNSTRSEEIIMTHAHIGG